jgi:cytochrome c oxidase cbb3-type subunit 1
LLILFIVCGVWLVASSVFALIASIKFHSPNFLADIGWLTYGRVRPASNHTLLYGFCVPAGLGVSLAILARLGGTGIEGGWLVGLGALFWNLGVAAGAYGILSGDSTGFENLEHPLYAAVFLSLGYLLIALSGAMTFHGRQNRVLFPSQWFILTALFWFAWIYSTAQLLLNVFEVRGMAQAVIAWWYAGNLQVVWMWLVGLAALFYLVSRITGRPLQNRGLALFIYWTLLLFGTWSGIPATAPVPSWLPSASTVSTVLLALPLLALIIALKATLAGQHHPLRGPTGLRFAGFAALTLLVAGAMQIISGFVSIAQLLNFTWFTTGRMVLNNYAFFVMTLFGATYFLLEDSLAAPWPAPRLVRVHFYLAAVGVLLLALPLVAGGVLEGFKLRESALPFVSVSRFTLHFLRLSTIGDLLLAAGNTLLLVNLVALAWRVFRTPVHLAYKAAAADLFPVAEVRS